MHHIRFNIRQSNTGHSNVTYFKLPALPPTSENVGLHVRRGDHQACTWRAAFDSDSPEVDATDYGWLVGFTHHENYERA